MEIKVFNTAAEVTSFVAEEILNAIESNPKLNLGVATGRTMDAVYHNLVQGGIKQNFNFQGVNAFAVDEYVGLEKGSANSYEAYLNLHLFNQLNFLRKNIHLPNVHLEDIDRACTDYENAIKSVGGIDLQLLGIGLNGHIGLNEPGSAIDSRTRIVGLSSTTRRSNKVLVRNENMPLTAVTMGIGTILDAKKCFLIATGETKAEIVQKVVNGDINSKIPATALKQHKNTIFVLDKDAAKYI